MHLFASHPPFADGMAIIFEKCNGHLAALRGQSTATATAAAGAATNSSQSQDASSDLAERSSTLESDSTSSCRGGSLHAPHQFAAHRVSPQHNQQQQQQRQQSANLCSHTTLDSMLSTSSWASSSSTTAPRAKHNPFQWQPQPQQQPQTQTQRAPFDKNIDNRQQSIDNRSTAASEGRSSSGSTTFNSSSYGGGGNKTRWQAAAVRIRIEVQPISGGRKVVWLERSRARLALNRSCCRVRARVFAFNISCIDYICARAHTLN